MRLPVDGPSPVSYTHLPAEHTPGNPDLPAAADEMSGVAVSGHHPAAGWLDPQALDPHIAAAVSDEPHPRPA